jgi:DNA-directed RNA polymerase specialized sigma24 family protein
MGAEHGGFPAFAVAAEPALLRTAFLLTGDRGDAEDLVVAALARAHRDWERVRQADEPAAAVRRLLVARSLRRRRVPWRGEQVLEELPEGPADGRLDALERALDALPARTRAVLVLRYADDLGEDETAAVVGRPVDAVRGEAGRGLAAVRAALPPAIRADGEADLDGDRADDDVRDALRRLATRAPRPRGMDTADAAVATGRRQRRTVAVRAGAAVALAALAAVLAVAVPAVLPDAGPAPEEAAAGRTGQAAVLSDTPVRGSLAGDADFVAGVAALDWSAPLGLNGAELAPEESTRQVLFAGDLPGGRRWALVVGEDEGQGLFAWFGGPAGARPSDLTLLAPPERFARRSTVSLLDTAGAAPLVVVVAPPGDRARYSPGTIRFDDGAIGREWTDLPVVDGVLVGEVELPVYPGAEVVELARDGLRPTQLEFLPRTDGSAAPDWPFGQPVDERLWTDRAAQGRFLACLPEGFSLRIVADGSATFAYPTVDGRRSDVELAQLYADWDTTVTGCTAEALGGG